MAVVSAPVAAAAAAVLWRTQGRPLLFTQTRVGRDGREFTIYKFRTMVEDAAASGAGMWFDRDDPRITPAGRLLRATSIDELPADLEHHARRHVAGRAAAETAGDRQPLPEPLPADAARPPRTDMPGGDRGAKHAAAIADDLRRPALCGRVSLVGDLSILARTVPVVLFRLGFHAEDESEEFVEDVPADGSAQPA